MLIKAENLHKVYREGREVLTVLEGINLSVESRKVSVIVGPSGAGKSTLLHILGALDTPTKGKVLFDDVDLYAAGDIERSLIRNKRIGFVFQFYHLLAEFTSVENVAMPALIANSASRNKKEIFKKAEALLDLVGLKRRINHRPSELSGGEAQRVAIARALINDPDIVFCDEPTGNLDSANSKVILGIIKELNKEKKQTFLIVTHDEKLATFCDRIIHMKDGKLEGERS